MRERGKERERVLSATAGAGAPYTFAFMQKPIEFHIECESN